MDDDEETTRKGRARSAVGEASSDPSINQSMDDEDEKTEKASASNAAGEVSSDPPMKKTVDEEDETMQKARASYAAGEASSDPPNDEMETTEEKARARKAAGEALSWESPLKKAKVDHVTSPIATTDRPPSSDHSGGRRDDPEITESKRQMLAMSLLQRFTKFFELQIEEEQRKKNLQIGIDDEIQRLMIPKQKHPSVLEVARLTAMSIDENEETTESARERKVADEASSSNSHMVDEIEPLKHHSVIERVLTTTRDETNRPLIQLQHIPVIAQNWTDEEELQRNQNDGAPAGSDQTVRNAEPTEEEKKQPRNKE